MVNKVYLLGRVGKDPDTRFTQSGQIFCKFSLATSEKHKNQAGELIETTEWHNITCWGKTAEIAKQYVHKGKQLHIEGRLHYSQSEKDGVKHYFTEVVVDRLTLLGSKDDARPEVKPAEDEYDIGDLGPPLDMDNKPMSPGD